MSLLLLHPRELAVKRLIGDTARAFRHGSRIHPNRAPYEFYPTPPAATRALLAAEDFDGPIWEPACGQGHIAKVLETAGHQVISTDLLSYGYGAGGRDFLAEARPLAKHIVTNPPYGRGLADAFVRHALKLTRNTGGKVAMLLSIDSLCHPMRHTLFTGAPPKVIYCLDECHCWPEGDPSKATASLKRQRYCWAVWQAGHCEPTQLRWLSTSEPFTANLADNGLLNRRNSTSPEPRRFVGTISNVSPVLAEAVLAEASYKAKSLI